MLTLPLLAEIMNRNEFDTDFVGKFVQVLLLLSALGMGSVITWAVSKRKPSMDVSHATHEQRLTALEGGQRLLFKKFDEINAMLNKLAIQQGSNSESIRHTANTVEKIEDQVSEIVKHLLNHD